MEKPGDFYFKDNCIYIALAPQFPELENSTGGFTLIRIPVQRGVGGRPGIWGWDGNYEKPTLTPSLLVSGHWHGFMHKGRLESC